MNGFEKLNSNGDRIMALKNNIHGKRKFLWQTISCFFLVGMVLICNISAEEFNKENKITVTSAANSNDTNHMFQSNPISVTIADSLSEIDHVQLVVPVVIKIFGFNMDNRPSMDDFPGNFTGGPLNGNNSLIREPPNWEDESPPSRPNNDEFPQWENESPMDENMNRNFEGYIIEGTFPDSLNSIEYSYVPDTLLSGRMLEKDDTNVAYIGEEAQEYFNTSVGETISIQNVTFTVIGIFSDEELSNYVIMNITDAQNLLGYQYSEVNTFYVYVDDENYLEDVSSLIEENYPNFMIRYSGQNELFNPQNNNPFQSANVEQPNNDLMTPGFEFTFLICIMLFLSSTQRKQKEVTSHKKKLYRKI